MEGPMIGCSGTVSGATGTSGGVGSFVSSSWADLIGTGAEAKRRISAKASSLAAGGGADGAGVAGDNAGPTGAEAGLPSGWKISAAFRSTALNVSDGMTCVSTCASAFGERPNVSDDNRGGCVARALLSSFSTGTTLRGRRTGFFATGLESVPSPASTPLPTGSPSKRTGAVLLSRAAGLRRVAGFFAAVTGESGRVSPSVGEAAVEAGSSVMSGLLKFFRGFAPVRRAGAMVRTAQRGQNRRNPAAMGVE